jgi:microcystin-dependent protein
MFGGNFQPLGWVFCDGRLLPISENDQLFALIGTTYGGDGQSTFAVPDLQGRLPIHAGQGGGLQNYTLGETGGAESATLTVQQMPAHTHPFLASQSGGTSGNPQNNTIGSPPTLTMFIVDNPVTPLLPQSVQAVGGSQPHENRMPFLTITFIISLFGVYPSET